MRAPILDIDDPDIDNEFALEPARITLRERALRLAADGPIGADLLARASGSSRNSCLTTLWKLAREQRLVKASEGWYVRPDDAPVRFGERAELARAEDAAEAFLSSKEQFPGALSPLPVNRAPNIMAPVRRPR